MTPGRHLSSLSSSTGERVTHAEDRRTLPLPRGRGLRLGGGTVMPSDATSAASGSGTLNAPGITSAVIVLVSFELRHLEDQPVAVLISGPSLRRQAKRPDQVGTGTPLPRTQPTGVFP